MLELLDFMVTRATSAKGRPSQKAVTFWNKLPHPFFVLAPMANVTDFAFRSMIAKYGKPDVMWNEFVSANGLCSAGRERLMHDLKFSTKERPIVAQLFTGDAVAMKKATKLCADLGFDGVDLNMGCPDRTIEKQGSGAGHIKEPQKAIEVLEAARQGWKEGKKEGQRSKVKGQKFNSKVEKELQVPISVKTRIGYNKIEMDWLRLLLGQRLPALTVHLRTRKEMSDVPAHWELMPEILKLRDEVQNDIPVNERTLIIGNGDVTSVAEAQEKCDTYGCDGVMIGRGIFGTPWLFADKEKFRSPQITLEQSERKSSLVTDKIQIKSEVSNLHHSNNSHIRIDTPQKNPQERLTIMLEHTKLFEKTYCGSTSPKLRRSSPKKLKNFAVMKKHFKAYVSGWDGAKELRTMLMETNSYQEVQQIVSQYMKKQESMR